MTNTFQNKNWFDTAENDYFYSMNVMGALTNKKIVLAVTGSIAAYKSIILARLLVKAGAEVKVVMTTAAKDFASPLVLSVLTKNKVSIEWQEGYEWNNHVQLGRWADLMLIAPLSCNTIGKMAAGICDNLLLAVYLSANCPVVVAPSMDEDMWLHPATQKNIAIIRDQGVAVIPVNNGELASGLQGEGRMAEPEEILTYITEHFFRGHLLKGKKVLVTAGPTYEPIDPVRFIGNRSSGKMGFALAEAFYLQGADVVLVKGPTREQTRFTQMVQIPVETAEQMFAACEAESGADIIIMSAAVADFTPEKTATEKIKKSQNQPTIELKPTKDILKHLGLQKRQGQFIAGFALETENEKDNAFQKLHEKNMDCIILNSLREPGAGFDVDTNKISIINKDSITDLALMPKTAVAEAIVNYVIEQLLKKNN